MGNLIHLAHGSWHGVSRGGWSGNGEPAPDGVIVACYALERQELVSREELSASEFNHLEFGVSGACVDGDEDLADEVWQKDDRN